MNGMSCFAGDLYFATSCLLVVAKSINCDEHCMTTFGARFSH